jgi:hypothetical protein
VPPVPSPAEIPSPAGQGTGGTRASAGIKHCETSAQIVTDDATMYPVATGVFDGGHKSVNHSENEYVRKETDANGNTETITTNSAEAYFSLLKRGIYGTFHHVSRKHLFRYCDEFSFRWNGRTLKDSERRTIALTQIEGKRLTYHTPVGEA